MQLNGAIDRDLFGVDIKGEVLSQSSVELSVKGCFAFSIQNLGNVPVIIDGNISLGAGECNLREFKNIGVLDFARNLPLQWVIDNISNPDARVEVIKYYLVRK